jgi:hypothetical protein
MRQKCKQVRLHGMHAACPAELYVHGSPIMAIPMLVWKHCHPHSVLYLKGIEKVRCQENCTFTEAIFLSGVWWVVAVNPLHAIANLASLYKSAEAPKEPEWKSAVLSHWAVRPENASHPTVIGPLVLHCRTMRTELVGPTCNACMPHTSPLHAPTG